MSEIASSSSSSSGGGAPRGAAADDQSSAGAAAAASIAPERRAAAGTTSRLSTQSGPPAAAAGKAGPLWSAAKARVDSLYSQWVAARAECNLVASSFIEIPPHGSFYIVGGGPSSDPKDVSSSAGHPPATGQSSRSARQVAPDSSSRRKPFSTDFSSSALSSISSSDDAVPHTSRGAISSRASSAGRSRVGGSPLAGKTAAAAAAGAGAMTVMMPTPPSRVLLYNMLGLKPPASFLSAVGGSETMASAAQSLEIDLPKVFRLQRDLVEFSQRAHEVCVEQAAPSETSRHSDNKAAQLNALRDSARSLLLHLAAYAPVAPLKSSSVVNSYTSGLDALVAEVLGSRGKSSAARPSPTLERAIERATAEQVALSNSLYFASVHFNTVQEKDRRKQDSLKRIGAQIESSFKKQDAELQDLLVIIQAMIRDTRLAEQVRIDLGGEANSRNSGSSRKQTALTNPLDALARGYMGVEIAAFVNSVRAFAVNYEALEVCIDVARKSMKDGITGALKEIRA